MQRSTISMALSGAESSAPPAVWLLIEFLDEALVLAADHVLKGAAGVGLDSQPWPPSVATIWLLLALMRQAHLGSCRW